MTINDRIEFLYDRDHAIGHSYFLKAKSLDDLREVILHNVIPLLQEYFYGDWEKICLVLGCPHEAESGKPLKAEQKSIIKAVMLKEQDVIGFEEFLPTAQLLDIGPDALELQQAYIVEGILSEKWYDDALHVALATVAECNVIVSWNFKHIVNFRKIPLFNAVNVLKGYRQIAIHSPLEVINYEE
jgi:hypothetical protein